MTDTPDPAEVKRMTKVQAVTARTPSRDEITRAIYDTLSGQYGDFNMPCDAADAVLALLESAPSLEVPADAPTGISSELEVPDELAELLLAEGCGPGNSIHGWRCEYPDRYGPCDCVTELANVLRAHGYGKRPTYTRQQVRDLAGVGIWAPPGPDLDDVVDFARALGVEVTDG